jgi:hypothetical protein
LDKDPGTYWYRVRANTVLGYSEWSNVVKVTVEQPPRQITLKNSMSEGNGNILDQVVQFKVSATNSFGSSDYLTDDAFSQCRDLPGEGIYLNDSRSFIINQEPPYFVYIGIGTWETDFFMCSSDFPFFKRTSFTTVDWEFYNVWIIVQVLSHEGNWNWEIKGDYTMRNPYNLKLYIDGNPVTVYDFKVTPVSQ